jgi:hypothetical protein
MSHLCHLRLHNDFLPTLFFTACRIDVRNMAMNSGLSLAHKIQHHTLHGMSHSLPSLPKWKQSDAEGAEEEPENSYYDPAYIVCVSTTVVVDG